MQIHCDSCDKLYDIPKGNTQRLLKKILFFAKCPHCGMLRNENSKHFPYPRCNSCNCPIAKGETCRADYMQEWRRIKKSRKIADFA